jgi:hypothetical protein
MADACLIDFDWHDMLARTDLAGLTVWRTLDGACGRAYDPGGDRLGWTGLTALQSLRGASAGQEATHHYVVETDVQPGHEDDFNAWYADEHLPGLAAVPGAVAVRRFMRQGTRQAGSPLYLACYDLTTPDTLQRPEWLAVRHTAWSDRVRPCFTNTRRTMHVRADLWRAPNPQETQRRVVEQQSIKPN